MRSQSQAQSSFSRTALQSTQTIDRRAFDATIAARRELSAHQADLRGYHAKNQLVTAINESDARVETMRRLKRIQQQNGELQQAYQYENMLKEKIQRQILTRQDEELAAAMTKAKNEEIAKQQNHRRICDESDELNELRSLLSAAQLNKTRATQLSEKVLQREQEAAQHAAMEHEMELDRLAAVKLEMEEMDRRSLINMQSRNFLQNQMAERELRKQLAYEQFLKEKAVIDDIVKSIELDDAMKLKVQLQKQKELQDNIRTYLEERARWRNEEKKRAELELHKIQEYQKLQEERHAELMRQKQKKVDLQDKVLEKLTLEIEAKRREEEEMQKLLYELYQEEAESKAIAEIKAREEKVNRMKREMIDANEYQKAFKAQKLREQQLEEADFRQKMMEKFAADKRLEQMNAERRRREMQEYKNEVEHIISERKALYEAAVEQELKQREDEQKEREYKLSVVEAERQRLLEAYARDLKDYLPKGVLKSAADYERVFDKKPSVEQTKGLGKQGTMNFR